MANTDTQRTSTPRGNRDPVRDGLIVLCMTVVALALGIGLHLQFAMTFWLAVVAALSVYVALLSAHVLIRRSEHVERLRGEVAALEAKLAAPGQRQAPPPMQPRQPRTAAAPVAPTVTPPTPQLAPPLPSPPADVAAREAAIGAATASLSDYWNYAPARADGAQPELPKSRSRDREPAPRGAVPPAGEAAPPTVVKVADKRARDAEAEQIDAVIKKLAADITQGQAKLGKEAGRDQLRNDAPLPASQPVAQPPSAVGSPADALPLGMAEVDESVAALHAAADAMREAGRVFEQSASPVPSAPPPLAAPPVRTIAARPAPPPLPPRPRIVSGAADSARERLAAVAEALEKERFDVMLQPILGLADRRAQHYAVSVRLRPGIIEGAGEAEVFAPGSGLLPLLDAVKVESAARVAWRMEDRGRTGALFSELGGESLVSDQFLNRFADTYRQGDTLGSRLVLSFRQAEVRIFSELQQATLRDMADLGFRFCLDEITDLDMDFAALAGAGFTFARLDAATFLDGLAADETVVPAADICRHFADLGFAVIVGGIADEAVSAQLLSYGVGLGLGELFGQPRPVKADVLRNPHAAVA